MNKQAAAEAAAHDHRGRLGASKVAALMGRDPRTTPVQAWLQILGRPDPVEKPPYLREAADWGLDQEAIVVSGRAGYEARTGWKVQRVNETLWLPGFPVSPDGKNKGNPALTCHLDRRVVGQPRIVQVKTRDARVQSKWGEPETDQIPECELIQMVVELAIARRQLNLALTFNDAAVLFGGNTFARYPYELHLDLEARVLARAEELWHHYVVERNTPPAQSDEDCRRIWYQSTRAFVAIESEWLGPLRNYIEGRETEKAGKAQKDAAAVELKTLLGDAEEVRAEIHQDGKPPAQKAVAKWPNRWEIDEESLRQDTKPDARSAVAKYQVLDVEALAEQEPQLLQDLTKRFPRLDLQALKKGAPKVAARHRIELARGNLSVPAAATTYLGTLDEK